MLSIPISIYGPIESWVVLKFQVQEDMIFSIDITLITTQISNSILCISLSKQLVKAFLRIDRINAFETLLIW